MKLFISNFQKKLIVIFFSSCRISEKLCQFFNTFFCGHLAGTALKVEGRVRQKIITFHSWEESYFFQYIMQTCFFRTTLSDRISYYNLAPASELSILYNLPCYTLQKFRWTYVKFYFNVSSFSMDVSLYFHNSTSKYSFVPCLHRIIQHYKIFTRFRTTKFVYKNWSPRLCVLQFLWAYAKDPVYVDNT